MESYKYELRARQIERFEETENQDIEGRIEIRDAVLSRRHQNIRIVLHNHDKQRRNGHRMDEDIARRRDGDTRGRKTGMQSSSRHPGNTDNPHPQPSERVNKTEQERQSDDGENQNGLGAFLDKPDRPYHHDGNAIPIIR